VAPSKQWIQLCCLSSAATPPPPPDFEDERSLNPLSALFNPTEEHLTLRTMLRSFVEREVEPQAIDFNKREEFNLDLFRALGDDGLGILGLTAPEEYGGTGLDAAAVCLVHEELSYSDPAFCLSYLAHS
jgi:isovaleryl-CoA dehydrogenase